MSECSDKGLTKDISAPAKAPKFVDHAQVLKFYAKERNASFVATTI